jgi:hypothetical protein
LLEIVLFDKLNLGNELFTSSFGLQIAAIAGSRCIVSSHIAHVVSTTTTTATNAPNSKSSDSQNCDSAGKLYIKVYWTSPWRPPFVIAAPPFSSCLYAFLLL